MDNARVNQEAGRLAMIASDEQLARAIAGLGDDLQTYVTVRLKELGRIDVGFQYRWNHVLSHLIGARFQPGDVIEYRGQVVEVDWVWMGLSDFEYMTQPFGLVRQSWIKKVEV